MSRLTVVKLLSGLGAMVASVRGHVIQPNTLDLNDTGIDLALGNKVNDFLAIRAALSTPLDDFSFDNNCDFANQLFIRHGIDEAKNMAASALAKLSTENPFQNNVPYDDPWKAMRFAVFGTEQTTSQNTLIGGITFHCGEPALAVAATQKNPFDCVMCRVQADDGSFVIMDAFQFLSANEQEPDTRDWDTNHCGWSDGRNIALCTDTLPGGAKDFKLLSETTPAAGKSMGEFKRTYGATMLHELSHVYGTEDKKNGYDFDGVVSLRSNAESGTNRDFPGKNADSYAIFGT
ncbi:hypothetical protein LTR95_017456, partial [Oleoguttula sp. CCFEE 5521]